MSYRKPR